MQAAHGPDRVVNVPVGDAMLRLEYEMAVAVDCLRVHVEFSGGATRHDDLHHVDGWLADEHGCNPGSKWPVTMAALDAEVHVRRVGLCVLLHQGLHFATWGTFVEFRPIQGARNANKLGVRKDLERPSQTWLEE